MARTLQSTNAISSVRDAKPLGSEQHGRRTHPKVAASKFQPADGQIQELGAELDEEVALMFIFDAKRQPKLWKSAVAHPKPQSLDPFTWIAPTTRPSDSRPSVSLRWASPSSSCSGRRSWKTPRAAWCATWHCARTSSCVSHVGGVVSTLIAGPR